ncbi:Topoisomerase DNA-binding C4 zinc finger domain protein [Leptospira santarosai]|uniref:Topoisomerase DNA-binding C4 zinc finger domain protein n=1 Tax=Leptospira santarosai TaxID=28183 RepID=A0A2P1QUE0_9LEPT|nr:Topoisomerase DNA-binding C4 zinc finger domain protein [Leptospira santarosai]
MTIESHEGKILCISNSRRTFLFNIIICTKCDIQYYIHSAPGSFKDEGKHIQCESCNASIFIGSMPNLRFSIISVAKKKLEDEKGISTFPPKDPLVVYPKIPKCNCNEEMVVRKSHRGEFWGCANFPKGCKQTWPYIQEHPYRLPDPEEEKDYVPLYMRLSKE